MTQALLNNLNISQDNGLSLNDNAQKPELLDFAKILNNKTNQLKEDSVNKNDDSNFETDSRVLSIGDMKMSMQTEQALSDEINNAVQENAVEAVVDLTIIKEVFAEELEEAQKNEENTEQETNSEDNATIEPNITEEDPTMFEELNTFENSTVAVMLQSQQLSLQLKTVNENDEDTQESSTQIKDLKKDTVSNSNIFKQFETKTAKESGMININQKENIVKKDEPTSLNKILDEKYVKELKIEVMDQNSYENDSAADNLMKNQTPQEQAVKVMLQGDLKYEDISSNIVKVSNVKPTEITPSKIIEQISKQLDNMYNNSKLNIVLNPEKLGKVNLQIMNLKGMLTAQFTVTTQEAKDILLKGLDGLKENLLAQGVSVDNVSVKLEEVESEYHQDWTEQEGYKGGNRQQHSRKQREENNFEDMMEAEVLKNENNSEI